jgi:hypothetical protein
MNHGSAHGRAPGNGPHRGPDPRAGLGRHPGARTGPVWGQSCLKMSTGSQQSSSSQLKHRIRFRCTGVRAGPGPETGLRSRLARARVGWTGNGRAVAVEITRGHRLRLESDRKIGFRLERSIAIAQHDRRRIRV